MSLFDASYVPRRIAVTGTDAPAEVAKYLREFITQARGKAQS